MPFAEVIASLRAKHLAHLVGEPELGTNEAWDAEIERRGANVEEGSTETITLAEYRAHVGRRRAARASR